MRSFPGHTERFSKYEPVTIVGADELVAEVKDRFLCPRLGAEDWFELVEAAPAVTART